MGLDLILYKKTKPLAEMSVEEELDSELAYGRKTWAIADFFTRRCDSINGDYLYRVTEEDWDEFISSLDKLNDPNFRAKAENYVENVFAYDEEYEYKIGEELEAWLDGALNNDSHYTLGFDWELSAILKWFDADEEVREAFKEGYDIELLQSY